ncbi:ribonuclease Z [Paenibacillus swuensis]|uniref:Ribonuclease Z n=1 Tax=Paenibacillus swuensis TaxID=1178515 RepID=A0A172TLC9_9BACL|nr:ribonuclease Z [Paenibacillus swuensis]ANE47865.1 ribonuclease Z [Paenibacillus swuensis]
MDIYFLGTGAGMPTKERNVTSIALTQYEERGSFWLFDCGEATQHQVLRSPLKLSKLEFIWITHLHGDHIFGLPGLLSSRSNQGGTSPLTIFGPKGIEAYIRTSMQISQSRLNYDMNIVEISEGLVYEDEQCTVETALLDHRIDSYGYRIQEKPKPGSLDIAKVKSYGLLPGPQYGLLKNGTDVTLPEGTVIRSSDVVGPPQPGRIIVVLGDTRPCANVLRLAQGADLLVHEATFAQELAALAREFYHSTTSEAAHAAAAAGANQLVLTHISGRYADEGTDLLLEEARRIFPNTQVASDHSSYPIPLRAKEEK